MRLSPEEELTLLNYFNKLESSSTKRFALWKMEPDGALVFINDARTTDSFAMEKSEAEIQIGRSTLRHDLKTRAINALVGFMGQKKVAGVAIRDSLLIKELVDSINSWGKRSAKSTASKKVAH